MDKDVIKCHNGSDSLSNVIMKCDHGSDNGSGNLHVDRNPQQSGAEV